MRSRAPRGLGGLGALRVALPLLLLSTGCAVTAEDEAAQRAIDRARERNAYAGAAIVLLVTLAVRHLVGAVSRRRAARRAAVPVGWGVVDSPRPVPPWLAVAAATTEIACSGVLLGAGGLLGWALGPTPGPDRVVGNELFFVLVVVALVPVAAVAAGVAVLVQALAARLPQAGVPTLVLLGVPSAAIVATGASGFDDGRAGSYVGGGLVAAFGLLGVGGYWGEAVRRLRARRTRRGRPSD